ncbi:MAG: thiamine diphosphokinase [Acidimicrobiia bacterium]
MSAPVADRVLVFAGGDRCRPEDLDGLPADALVVAADSGAEHAVALGWSVDVLVGDLDSIGPELAARLEAAGTRVLRLPEAKDQTDLALALDTAAGLGARSITVVGGHGGRLDHLLANVALLAADEYAGVAVDARLGPARVTIVRNGRRPLTGRHGDLVTLLATGGAALGVSTGGLLFPLTDAELRPGSSRGVSNELLDPARAWVEVAEGTVTVIQPGVRGALADRAQLDRP